jgi:hypothetical protein
MAKRREPKKKREPVTSGKPDFHQIVFRILRESIHPKSLCSGQKMARNEAKVPISGRHHFEPVLYLAQLFKVFPSSLGVVDAQSASRI